MLGIPRAKHQRDPVRAGTRRQLVRRLRTESAILFGALAVSVAAALLPLS